MLHGLGDSGDGWAPVGAEWAPDLKHIKFVFPHAPNVSRTNSLQLQPDFASVTEASLPLRHHEPAVLMDQETRQQLWAVRQDTSAPKLCKACSRRRVLPALHGLTTPHHCRCCHDVRHRVVPPASALYCLGPAASHHCELWHEHARVV